MILDWGFVDQSLYKEVLEMYINNDQSFKGKVLEIFSPMDIKNGDYKRYFIARGIDKEKYLENDSIMSAYMNLCVPNEEKESFRSMLKEESVNFISLERPINYSNEEKSMIGDKFDSFIGGGEIARKLKEIFLCNKPQIRFIPLNLTDNSFEYIWKEILTSPFTHFWHLKNSSGEYVFDLEKKDKNYEHYYKIRSMDISDLKKVIDEIINKNENSFTI